MKKILIITTIALLALTVTLATLWYTHSTPEDSNSHSLYACYSEEKGICRLHGLPLQEDTVPIVYGLIANRVAYWRARMQELPHANSYIEGGCVVESIKKAKGFFALCADRPKQHGIKNIYLKTSLKCRGTLKYD